MWNEYMKLRLYIVECEIVEDEEIGMNLFWLFWISNWGGGVWGMNGREWMNEWM